MNTTTGGLVSAAFDDVWLHVCRFLEPQDLSALSRVNSKLHQVCCSREVFRSKCLDLSPFVNTGKGIDVSGVSSTFRERSWKHVFRNMRALRHDLCLEDTGMLRDMRVTFLCVASVEPLCIILYVEESDTICAMPQGWSRPRRDVTSTCTSKLLQRCVVSLKNGEVGFLNASILPCNACSTTVSVDPSSLPGSSGDTANQCDTEIGNACTGSQENQKRFVSDGKVSFIQSWTGEYLRCISIGGNTKSEVLCSEWTSGRLHHAPILLRGGEDGLRIVYASAGDIVCVDRLSGKEISRWRAADESAPSKDTFARIARTAENAVGGIVLRGGADSKETLLNIVDICSGATKIDIKIGNSDSFVDAVVSEDAKTVACRVKTDIGAVVVVLRSVRSRACLLSRMTLINVRAEGNGVRASAELAVLGNGFGVVYRPEFGVPFSGRVQIMLQRQEDSGMLYSIHTLRFIRAGGSAYKSATVSDDGRILFASAENGSVSVFNLLSGRCQGTYSVDKVAVEDAFLCSGAHALVMFTGAQTDNVRALHFSKFCRSGFPECSSSDGAWHESPQ